MNDMCEDALGVSSSEVDQVRKTEHILCQKSKIVQKVLSTSFEEYSARKSRKWSIFRSTKHISVAPFFNAFDRRTFYGYAPKTMKFSAP